MPSTQGFWATGLSVLLLSTSSQAAKQCYRLDGTNATNDMRPCDPDAEVSACCALNKSRPDICSKTGGLCLAQDDGYTGMLYANGCTDPTGKDKNCPQICRDKVGSGAILYNILQCNSGGSYCCRQNTDTTNCCNNKTLLVTGDLGTFQVSETKTVTVVSSSTATSTPIAASGTASSTGPSSTGCPKDNTAIVGGAVGGVLGAALLAALGAIAVLSKRRPRGIHNPGQYSAVSGKPPQYPPQELPGTMAHEMRG